MRTDAAVDFLTRNGLVENRHRGEARNDGR